MHARTPDGFWTAPKPEDLEKTEAWERMVREAYFQYTKAGAIARIEYDAGRPGSAHVLKQETANSVAPDGAFPNGHLGYLCAEAEFYRILDIAGKRAARVRWDGGRPNPIRECVERMLDAGCRPSVALVRPDHREQIRELYPAGVMDVGGAPIRIVSAPGPKPPKETFVLDPGCIEITYEATGEAGRIRLAAHSGIGEIAMTAGIRMSVKVPRAGGVAKFD